MPKPKLKFRTEAQKASTAAEAVQTEAPLAKAKTKVPKPVRTKETKAKKPRRYPAWMQGIVTFVRETRAEWSRVQWPTFRQAWHLTRIVLLVTFALGLFLGFMDWVFSQFIAFLLRL